MRLDFTLGEVPARLALDWRAQVAGDSRAGLGAGCNAFDPVLETFRAGWRRLTMLGQHREPT